MAKYDSVTIELSGEHAEHLEFLLKSWMGETLARAHNNDRDHLTAMTRQQYGAAAAVVRQIVKHPGGPKYVPLLTMGLPRTVAERGGSRIGDHLGVTVNDLGASGASEYGQEPL